MVRDEPDLHCPLVQVGSRERLDAICDGRAGDRQGVDLIGLAPLALTLARGAHPLRRHPHDPLPGRD